MTSIFQSEDWEQFKIATGYHASYRIDDILVLQKCLPLGRSMLYSPMVDQSQTSNLKSKDYILNINSLATKTKAIFHRAELDTPISEASSYKLEASGYIKAFEEMQPEHTLVIDITKPEAEILAQMKQKGRYNIKVAEKKQLSIVEENHVDNFYDLYATMAKRQNITYRNKDYYQKLFDILKPKGYVKVFTAYARRSATEEQRNGTTGGNNEAMEQWDNDTPVASAIISFYGDTATYLFGGSSDLYRNLMAPYLLQWTAIKEAKRMGCKRYDFFGIAPDDNPCHPWHGVTRFKKQFGGERVHIAGSYDLVFRPFEYRIFAIAEKIRRR